MALISRDMEAVFETGEASLTAKNGQSFLVTGIQVMRSAVDGVTISIEKDTVGYFLVNEPRGNHLGVYTDGTFRGFNALSYMYDKNLFSGYPVETGQTIRCDQPLGGNERVVFKYDLYDEGDVKASNINGTESNTYEYMSYGDYGADVTSEGIKDYKNSLTPSSLIRFPFFEKVPPRTEISVKAVFASPVSTITATPTSALTDRLLFVKDRKVLFDQDRKGLAFRGDSSLAPVTNQRGAELGWIADLTAHDPNPPYIFDQAIDFVAGESLDVKVDFISFDTFVAIAQAYTTIGFWQVVSKT